MGYLKFLIIGLVLTGCAGGFAELKDRAQAAADTGRNVALADDCAITVGSYFRMPKLQRLAIQIICGGDVVDELRALTGGAAVKPPPAALNEP